MAFQKWRAFVCVFIHINKPVNMALNGGMSFLLWSDSQCEYIQKRLVDISEKSLNNILISYLGGQNRYLTFKNNFLLFIFSTS